MSRFRAVVGTGGIGSGVFYRLEDNRDLGREESRPAHRLDQQDYCKQHIILHYLAVLARDLRLPLRVIPIGAVGADAAGDQLLGEMRAAGLRTDHVARLAGASTLTAVCYVFPDGSGGNLTESRSACARVTPQFIARAWNEINPPAGRTIVVAAPEVPLASRARLLQLGRERGAFNVAAFISQEIPAVKRARLLRLVDLLAVNRDEAATLCGVSATTSAAHLAKACQRALPRWNPNLRMVLTAGADGAYALAADRSLFLPALKLKPRNTAGAGDALLAGVVLGEILGLPWHADSEDTSLGLGRALAAMKILCPHTIHFGINLKTLRAFLQRHGETELLERLAARARKASKPGGQP